MLWDMVPSKILAESSRIVGVVVVRPYEDNFALEISYYANGNVSRESYLFTIGVVLLHPGSRPYHHAPMSTNLTLSRNSKPKSSAKWREGDYRPSAHQGLVS